MQTRIDLRLSPTDAKKLATIARTRTTNGSKPDALRMLIDEEHKRILQAGKAVTT